MTPKIELDLRDFDRTLQRYVDTMNKDLVDVINQRTANVVHWTLEDLPPYGAPAASRARIREYLDQPRADYNALLAGRVKSRRAKSSRYQLRLVNLIVNARRKKAGLKGVQGEDMIRAAGNLRRAAVTSVGFAKSLFIDIANRLNDTVKFKIPYALTRGIAVWSKPKGSGHLNMAKEGKTIEAVIDIAVDVTKDEIFWRQLLENAFQSAIQKETAQMTAQIEKELQATADYYAKAA